MKKITLVLILLLFSFNLFAQDINYIKDNLIDSIMLSGEANKKFVPKGKCSAVNVRQGKWKDYSTIKDITFYFSDEDYPKEIAGKYFLYGEGKYLNSAKIGQWTYWSINYNTHQKYLLKKMNFENEMAEGKVTYYYPNGSRVMEGNFVSGRFEGLVCKYYPTGEKYADINYKNGQRSGTQTLFYRNGVIKQTREYIDEIENGYYKAYYPTGIIKEQCSYKNDTLQNYKCYYNNGNLWVEDEYKNGLPWNVNALLDVNGAPLEIGTFKNGSGDLNYYDIDGKLYLIQTYLECQLISEKEIQKNPKFE
ncbi:MAG: hypothetical protein NT150_00610 [Bacteroidetes bacterium]|nr:hypothetical protein [Bacteroidota bacterium]